MKIPVWPIALIPLACVEPAPAENTRTPADVASAEPALVPVSWKDVADEHAVWHAVYAAPRTVLLIGSPSCVPCHVVKTWWSAQEAPVGWSFVYWELTDEPRQSDQDVVWALGTGNRPGASPFSFPVVAVIEGAHPGAPIEDVVTANFWGYPRCTMNLALWLRAHPRGLKPPPPSNAALTNAACGNPSHCPLQAPGTGGIFYR